MPTASGLPPDGLDKLVQAVEDLVTAAIRRIAGALARVIRGSPNVGAVHPVDDAAMILPLWATATTVTLVPAVQSVWTASAVALSEEFTAAGVSNSPLGPDQAAAYLEGAANRLVGIGNIVWAQVRTQLAEGVNLGEGIPELAERVMEAAGVSEERATVIARTEVISASNAASFAQAQTLQDSTMSKVWMATPDARTRHTHVVADGQTQPLMSPFEVGGFPLMFPGDPAGPPQEVISCRCTQGYDFEVQDVPPDETTVAAFGDWDVIVADFDPDQLRDNLGRWSKMRLNRLGVYAYPGDIVPSSERIRGIEGEVRVAHVIDGVNGEHNIFIGSGTAAQMSGWQQTAGYDGRTAFLGPPDVLIAALNTALANVHTDHVDGPVRVMGDDLGDVDVETIDTPDGVRVKVTVADYDSQAEYEIEDPPETFEDEDGNPRPLTDEERAEWIAEQEAEAVKANEEFAPGFAVLTPEQVAQLVTALVLDVPPDTLTAAAQVHTGAMVALAPCVDDAYRLEVGAGEPAEQLHTTLVYLGDDADLTAEQRHTILGMCVDLASQHGPMQLDAFGVSIFNPTSDERDTAIVLPLGGEEGPDLAALHDAVTAGVQLHLGDAMPQQHEPFAAHLTLAYTDDLSMAEQWTDRNGPILFDHLRVAFGGDVFDIPLSTCGCGYDTALTAGVNNNPEFNRKHLRGPGGRFKALGERVADAVSSGEGLDGFDREQLRKAAKTHGIELKRGESEDSIKRKLVDKLGGKSGTKETGKEAAPKAPAKRAPRKVAKKAAPAAPPKAAGRAAEVARINDTPIVGEPRRLGGTSGITSLEEHEGGLLVRKDEQRFGSFAEHPDNYGRDPVESADSEELAALVGEAVGVRTPAVMRTSPTEILMEHIDGKSGADIVTWGKPPPDDLLNSDSGRLMGLLDVIVLNADRNEGNWIVDGNGDIAGIDHAESFNSPDAGPRTGSPFAAPFVDVARNDYGSNDMSPEDMATIRPRLEALRPQFDALGHGDWHTAMMKRFDQVAANATGTTSRLVTAA